MHAVNFECCEQNYGICLALEGTNDPSEASEDMDIDTYKIRIVEASAQMPEGIASLWSEPNTDNPAKNNQRTHDQRTSARNHFQRLASMCDRLSWNTARSYIKEFSRAFE